MALPTQQERRDQASIDSPSASSKSERSDQSDQPPQKDRQQMGLALAPSMRAMATLSQQMGLALAPSMRAMEAFRQAELASAPTMRAMATLSQQMGLALAPSMQAMEAVRQVGLASAPTMRAMATLSQQMGLTLAPSMRAMEAFHQAELASVAIHADRPLETSLLASMKKELSATNSERVARLSSRPSWLLTSQAILRGDSSFNLGWDILSSLHEQSEHQPSTFASLLRVTEAADAESGLLDVAIEATSCFYDAISKKLHSTLDTIELFSTNNILAFALVIFQLYLSIAQLNDSHAQLSEAQAQTKLAIASSSPRPIELELEKQIKQLSLDQDTLNSKLRNASNEPSTMAVVETTFIRKNPDIHGHIIQKVFPDEMAKIIRLSNEWAYVELFDYKGMQVATGWLMRRYMRSWQGR